MHPAQASAAAWTNDDPDGPPKWSPSDPKVLRLRRLPTTSFNLARGPRWADSRALGNPPAPLGASKRVRAPGARLTAGLSRPTSYDVTVPGQVIADRYQLEREIGQGAMGSVWLSKHLTLGTSVAVKLIAGEAARNADALARFAREAQLAARIRRLQSRRPDEC